jgi:hypothetical protein
MALPRSAKSAPRRPARLQAQAKWHSQVASQVARSDDSQQPALHSRKKAGGLKIPELLAELEEAAKTARSPTSPMKR